MAQEGQARAGDPAQITDSALLEFIAKELAASSSTLVTKLKLTQEQVQSKIQPLIERGWVRAQGALENPSTVFSITQGGAEALERNTKRGLSAYF